MSYVDYTKEDLIKIKEMFDFFDKNKEGGLNIEDLKLAVIGLGGELTVKEITEIKNQKELFDFEDLVSICKQKRINISDLENKLLLAFSLLEIDKKGFIPKSSLESLLKNDKIPDKDIQQLINEAKPDKDNNIDYRSFVKEIIEANSDDEPENKNNNANSDNENNNKEEDDNSDY